MAKNPEQMECISLLVCDEVYRDERTKKLVIIGTFNRITASALPCRHPKMTVVFTLTNARGEYDFGLFVEHEKTGRRIVEMRGPMKVDDPLRISEINLEIHGLVFQDAGKYWVTLEADGAILQLRPFWLDVQGVKE